MNSLIEAALSALLPTPPRDRGIAEVSDTQAGFASHMRSPPEPDGDAAGQDSAPDPGDGDPGRFGHAIAALPRPARDMTRDLVQPRTLAQGTPSAEPTGLAAATSRATASVELKGTSASSSEHLTENAAGFEQVTPRPAPPGTGDGPTLQKPTLAGPQHPFAQVTTSSSSATSPSQTSLEVAGRDAWPPAQFEPPAGQSRPPARKVAHADHPTTATVAPPAPAHDPGQGTSRIALPDDKWPSLAGPPQPLIHHEPGERTSVPTLPAAAKGPPAVRSPEQAATLPAPVGKPTANTIAAAAPSAAGPDWLLHDDRAHVTAAQPSVHPRHSAFAGTQQLAGGQASAVSSATAAKQTRAQTSVVAYPEVARARPTPRSASAPPAATHDWTTQAPAQMAVARVALSPFPETPSAQPHPAAAATPSGVKARAAPNTDGRAPVVLVSPASPTGDAPPGPRPVAAIARSFITTRSDNAASMPAPEPRNTPAPPALPAAAGSHPDMPQPPTLQIATPGLPQASILAPAMVDPANPPEPMLRFEREDLLAGPGDTLRSSEALATATARVQPAAGWPADHGRAAAQQLLATAAAQQGGGSVEITLSPEELGRVRMTMSGAEGAMTITVQAERSETLDLLRRNIDLLAEELRDMGYDTLNFSFDQGHPHTDDQAPAPGDGQATPPTSVVLAATPSISRALSAEAGLDLRL